MLNLETTDAERKLRASLIFFSYSVNNNENHLKSHGIFILNILRIYSSLSIEEMQNKLKEDFELEIPLSPLGDIITSLKGENLIEIDKSRIAFHSDIKYYGLTQIGYREASKCRDISEIKKELEPFYQDIQSFLNMKLAEIVPGVDYGSIEHIKKVVLKFIGRNLSPLLYYTHRSEDKTEMIPIIDDYFKKSKDKTDMHLCEYTRHIKLVIPDYYDLLKKLIEGTLISYYFNMDPQYLQYKKTMQKPDIYVDTNLLIFMLGYQYDEFTKPAKELKKLLNEWNFKIKVFRFTVVELSRVLSDCTSKKNKKHDYNKDYPVNSICSFFQTHSYSKTKILRILRNLDETIKGLGIDIIETRVKLYNYEKGYINQLEEDFLRFRRERRMRGLFYWDSKKAIDHDISALLKIKELRSGNDHIKGFEKSTAIFLTADQGLANYSLKSHLDEETIPEIYLDRSLMEFLWVKDPQANISVESLIATCSRDIFIHPHIWDYFIDKLSEKYPGIDNIEQELNDVLNHEINDRLASLDPKEFSKVDIIIDEFGHNLLSHDQAIETENENPNDREATESEVTKPIKNHIEPDSRKDISLGNDKILILHISDLHIKSIDQAKIFKTQLETDLYNINIKHIEYMIISGDIASEAEKEEYDGALYIVEFLLDNFGLTRNHIIVVPGNHDISYEDSEKSYQFISWRKLKKDNLVYPSSQYFEDGKTGIQLYDPIKYKQRFNNFNEFFYSKLLGEAYPLDYENQIKIFKDPATGILFLSLNSSWEIDHYYEKRGGVLNLAISNALDKFDADANYWLKVVVLHHPIRGDESIDSQFVDLLASRGFNVCIHGHIHKAISDFHKYDMNHLIRIIGAGAFGEPSSTHPNMPLQYNLIEINKNHEIRVCTRKKEKPYGPWCADPIWGDKIKDPKPCYKFDIKCLDKAP